MSAPALFLFRVVLGVLNSLHSHITLKISLSVSTERATGTFIGVALNLWNILGGEMTFSNTEFSDPGTCVSPPFGGFL